MDCRQQRFQGLHIRLVEEVGLSPMSSEEETQCGNSHTKWENQQWRERSLKAEEELDWEVASDSSSVVFIEEWEEVRRRGSVGCTSDLDDFGENSAHAEVPSTERLHMEGPEVILYPNGPPSNTGFSTVGCEEIAYRGEACVDAEMIRFPEGPLGREESEEEEAEDISYEGRMPIEKVPVGVEGESTFSSEGFNGEGSEEIPCWGGTALGKTTSGGESAAIGNFCKGRI